jgi:hypothetical protein
MLNSDAITDIEVREPLQLYRNGSTVSITYSNIEPIWAKLTAKGTAITAGDGLTHIPYSWRKQVYKGGGQFEDSADYVEGYRQTDLPPTWPAFPTDDADTPIGSVVRLYPGVGDQNPDPTQNHGTEWFFVVAKSGSVMLKVMDSSTYNPYYFLGKPARIQRYDPTTHGYVDASPTLVYVNDPNGDLFRPGEFIKGELVETFAPGTDVYERTGLDALAVNIGLGGGSQYPSIFPAGGYPAIRFLNLRYPAYTENPKYPNTPGTLNVEIAPSSVNSPGILLGFPGWNSPGYDPNDPYRESSQVQWARGGYTGFDYLLTHGVLLGTGQPPNGPGAAITPNDAEVLSNVFASGQTTVTGGDNAFAVRIATGGQGFNIYANAGSGGIVNWGSAANTGIYDHFNIYTHNLDVSSPGLGPLIANIRGEFHVGGINPGTGLDVGPDLSRISYGTSLSGGSALYLQSNQASLSSSGIVILGPTTQLGISSFGSTIFLAQNVVKGLDPSYSGVTGPGYLRDPRDAASAYRFGYVFFNGLYLGGLEWLLALRTNPNTPTGSSYMPVQIQASGVPAYWLEDSIGNF